jgi:hypothetical protein
MQLYSHPLSGNSHKVRLNRHVVAWIDRIRALRGYVSMPGL